ncbi:MAG: DedA family protein [Mycetocola sp.]
MTTLLAQDSSVPLDGIAGWAVSLMEALGEPGAGLAVALENLFPPLPSEIILPLAGFSASQGTLQLIPTIAWTTAGSIIGALALYLLGVVLGEERLRAIARRLPLVNESDITKTQAWFERHGSKAVFFGRMIPIFRSLISIPAGLTRMPLPRFLILTGLGSLIWNSVFVGAGFVLGENWMIVEEYAGVFQKVVIAAVVLGVGWGVWKLVRRRQAAHKALNRPDEENGSSSAPS